MKAAKTIGLSLLIGIGACGYIISMARTTMKIFDTHIRLIVMDTVKSDAIKLDPEPDREKEAMRKLLYEISQATVSLRSEIRKSR